MRLPSLMTIARRTHLRGFTLLEMCVVLFIMAMVAAFAMPALNSAFKEQALRGDSQRFSIMVRTAMLKAREQGRPYVVTLDGRNLTMAPAAAQADDSDQTQPAASGDVTQSETLGSTVKFPDAYKKNAWNTLPSVTWTFQPDALCPMPQVRIEDGDAYLVLDFDALTGDTQEEASYLP